jgi:hypothetical protein
MTSDREQQTMAAGILLSIAQDENVRPGLRIHAARTVMLGNASYGDSEIVYGGVQTDEPEHAHDDATDDVIEDIASRVAAKLKETT